MPLTIFVGKTNEIPAEPGARANARDCHAPCFRTCRASPRRGSSIAFGTKCVYGAGLAQRGHRTSVTQSPFLSNANIPTETQDVDQMRAAQFGHRQSPRVLCFFFAD